MAKTKKDFEKWVKLQIKYYLPIIGKSNVEVSVIPNKTNDNYLDIGLHYPYIDTNIRYSDRAHNDWVKGKLTKYDILHELCHIITDPFYAKAVSRYISKDDMEDERERLTDEIMGIIRRIEKRK